MGAAVLMIHDSITITPEQSSSKPHMSVILTDIGGQASEAAQAEASHGGQGSQCGCGRGPAVTQARV